MQCLPQSSMPAKTVLGSRGGTEIIVCSGCCTSISLERTVWRQRRCGTFRCGACAVLQCLRCRKIAAPSLDAGTQHGPEATVRTISIAEALEAEAERRLSQHRREQPGNHQGMVISIADALGDAGAVGAPCMHFDLSGHDGSGDFSLGGTWQQTGIGGQDWRSSGADTCQTCGLTSADGVRAWRV